MNTYELTLLFAEKSEAKDKVMKMVTDFVKKAKGEVVKQDSWGVKTLAYPINKQNTAEYEYFLLSLDPAKQPELDKSLSLTEGIMRYLFIRV